MTYTHVAHDCRIGNHVILGNSVGLAGHVMMEDWADISPFSGVHQFCRIGRHCVHRPLQRDQAGRDAVLADQHAAGGAGVRRELRSGWRGAGSTNRDIEALQTAFRLLTRAGLNTSQAIERIARKCEPCAEVDELLEFIAASQRGVIKG